MALLMLGAYGDARAAPRHRRAGHCAADRGRRDPLPAACRQTCELQRQLRRRQFCPLPQNSGPGRLGRRHRHVARLRQARAAAALRICGADRALHARHDDADLGRRSDRALSRPRTDEPAALRGRRQPSRFAALDRSRIEIFRARCAVVGNAALRRVAGLRFYRHRELCRHRAGRRPWRHRADLRPGFSVCRLLLQGLRRAVPHVDAGRL